MHRCKTKNVVNIILDEIKVGNKSYLFTANSKTNQTGTLDGFSTQQTKFFDVGIFNYKLEARHKTEIN